MYRYNQINQFLDQSNYFYTIAIGMDSIYKFVSPNYDRNFGLGKKSLEGQHFSVTLHPEDISICENTGARCFAFPGQLFQAKLRKHDGKGGYVITQWEMQGMFDKSGTPEGIYCIGYNITEFIDTKAKLDQAEDQLEEINFIQSHGVRRPLANILGITKLVSLAESDTERAQLIQMLEKSAKELDEVVKEITNVKHS